MDASTPHQSGGSPGARAAIARVRRARAIVLPYCWATAGHGTHTLAAAWKARLVELLKATDR